MKKILGALLAVALTLSTPVTAFAKTQNNNLTNTNPITITDGTNLSDLKIGETVKVPLKVKNSTISTMGTVIPMGDAGWIDFTRRATYMEYVMHIKPFHTSIKCDAEVMDIQSGMSRGSSKLFLEAATIPYTPYSGHQYSLTINGYTYNLTKPCVSIYAKVFWMN